MSNQDELLESIKNTAKTTVITMEHIPLLFVCTEDDIELVGIQAEDLAPVIFGIINSKKPDWYIFIVEGYAKQMHPEDVNLYQRGDIKTLAEQNDPSVFDNLNICLVNRNGPSVMESAIILGKIPNRELQEFRKADNFDSRILVRSW